jgi:hypothetical protein
MTRTLPLAALLLITAVAFDVRAQDTGPAAADTFEREALKTLKASHAAGRGVVVHIGGKSIAGVVKAIGPDVIVLSNRESGIILVRRERIDALEAD